MINRIVLVGRLTADPEVRYTQSGIAVANFSMAVERNYKDSSGEKPTDFINLIVWRKGAELIQEYVHKGDMLGIEGRLEQQKWQDRDGNNRTSYQVNVDNFQFLNSKRDGNNSTRDPGSDDAPPPSNGINPSNDSVPGQFSGNEGDDELPF